MTHDPLADFLTQVRNAARANKPEVISSFSRLKNDVAHLFKREGYVDDVQLVTEGKKQFIKVSLKHAAQARPITAIRRVSRPGRRHYISSREIPRVLGGLGTAIISTSRGVMTDHDARKQSVGGEVLCYIS
jgi:small subunit ribosomal protein S8